MWGAHEGMGWWMVFGAVWIAIFWALVVVVAAWVIARLTSHQTDLSSDAMTIARQRYARGELTREEFERMSEDLGRFP